MRTPIVVGNWKMNTDLADSVILAESIKNGTNGLAGVEIVLCPPYLWIYPVAEAIQKALGKRIKLGAQDLFWEDFGAYTGEISGKMLKELCEYAIIGHSERRNYLHETDDMINNKVHAALRSGIKPIICVGEYKQMEHDKKERGRPRYNVLKANILNQLSASLEGVPKKLASEIVIAYEPVWAIGTGHPATGAYANSVIAMLREKIFELYDLETSMQVRILYGGSVDGKNIIEFTNQPEIDGVLAGGASLKAKEFVKMCHEMA